MIVSVVSLWIVLVVLYKAIAVVAHNFETHIHINVILLIIVSFVVGIYVNDFTIQVSFTVDCVINFFLIIFFKFFRFFRFFRFAVCLLFHFVSKVFLAIIILLILLILLIVCLNIVNHCFFCVLFAEVYVVYFLVLIVRFSLLHKSKSIFNVEILLILFVYCAVLRVYFTERWTRTHMVVHVTRCRVPVLFLLLLVFVHGLEI